MAPTDYGVLGITFQGVRALQAACMIAIVGLTANFVSVIVSSNLTPPALFLGTLSIACFAVLYCVMTYILFLGESLPFFLCTIGDGLLLIALIVVCALVGKPLAYQNCLAIGHPDSASTAYDFSFALGSLVDQNGLAILYERWTGLSKDICLEAKSIWGLSIALCILFAMSASCTFCFWRRKPQLAKQFAYA